MTAAGIPRSANGLGRNWRAAIYMLVAGAVLGLFGPFGTFQALATLPRVIFWIVTVLVIGTISVAVYRSAKRVAQQRVPRWAVMLLSSCVTAAAGAGLLRFCLPLILPQDGGAPALAALFAQVLLVTVCLSAIGLVLERRREDGAAAPAAAPSPAATWRERLPPDLRAADLLALQAEDHYLRVHTSAGSTLILLRLGDAIAELGEEAGAQVHRSFWVARNAVEKVERDDARTVLVLRSGLRVPVSRGNQAKVREMGWG